MDSKERINLMSGVMTRHALEVAGENQLAITILTLLVMDLGYGSKPAHGHTPIRHQLAWDHAALILGDNLMAVTVHDMIEQRSREFDRRHNVQQL